MLQSNYKTTSRIFAVLLELTRNGQTASLDHVASKACVSKTLVKTVLGPVLGRLDGEMLQLPRSVRFELAHRAAKDYGLREIVRNLTWQEFEKFTAECLCDAGFQVKEDVRVEGGGRRWQIDVVGYREALLLGFDCKHWMPPNSLSKFTYPATRQRQALSFLSGTDVGTAGQRMSFMALPIILTLYDPPQALHKGSVLLPVEKLPDFLEGVTPVSTELPFIVSDRFNVENPIKELQS